MKQNLPYCRRCDLDINDGEVGMYCVCTARRLKEEAEKAAKSKQQAFLEARAVEKQRRWAKFEARFDRETVRLANWKPLI